MGNRTSIISARHDQKLTDVGFDLARLEETIAAVESSDAIIWANPVYTSLVSWQLIRCLSF